MNEPKVKDLLAKLSPRIDEMHDILSREMPANAHAWRRIANEARDLANKPYPPEDVEQFARTTLSMWGVGMGSFSDTFVTSRFEEVRDEVYGLLQQLQEAAREGALDTLAIRRHLTELETIFLDAGYQAEASHARTLLDAAGLDLSRVARFASELVQRKWIGLAGDAQAQIQGIVDRLGAAVQGRG